MRFAEKYYKILVRKELKSADEHGNIQVIQLI